MKVTETLNEGLKRGYSIEIPAAELDEKVMEKLTEAQPDVEMKGFRKGKVPLPLLKKQFGDRVMGEALQETIDGAMAKHLEESGDRPAVQPDMKMADENWTPGQDVKVDVSYEALPAIPEVDMSGIKLERMVVKADKKEVDEALANLAETAQNFEDRKKGSKAKDGDQVVIDFLGKVDDVPFDGGAAEDYPLVLGSGSFIPGFEEQLIGVKAGDEKEVKVTFPDDYQAENLKGKDAIFECKIKAVKEPKAATIDDEMAKQFGAEDLKGLTTQVEERLEAEYTGAALVDAEAKQIAHHLWHEENPEVEGHDHPEIETTDEHTKLAERRVRLGLLLAELGQKNEIEVTDAEMTQAMMNQARQYPGQERQFFEFVQKNPQMQQQMRAPIFEDKVVDYVFELAEIKDKKVKKADLEKAVEALDDEAA